MRRLILTQSARAHVGHIGSALSVADIVATLYERVMHRPSAADPERDRFLLGNGHAALALYVVLHLMGEIDAATLDTYCGDGTLLGVHPQHALAGVDFTMGSLGQGLSMATGAALAARLQDSPRRAFVTLSDAEMDEGSTWEAVMFAAHHRLANLVAVVDMNGQQALGYTRDVLNLDPLAARWRAFGWDVHEVDGHDEDAISNAIASCDTREGPPHVLVAATTFGRGVSFMQQGIAWHYLPLDDATLARALAEVEHPGVAGARP